MQNGGEILKNVGAQAVGYGFGVLTDRPFTPIKLLPPAISCFPQAYDFVTQVTGVPRVERVATLAFLLSGTGLLSKNGDPIVNTAAGGFIFVLSQYIDAMAKSGGGGSTPFVVSLPNRTLKKFSKKQHLQCQLALVGVFILSVGCSYIVIIFTKKLIKRWGTFKSTIKNVRFKPRRTTFVEWIKIE